MKTLYFNNFNCHNGDLHYYREFIKDIINRTKFDEYYFLEKGDSSKLLSDIPKLKFDKLNLNCKLNLTYYKINEDVYINIHYIRTNFYYYNINVNEIPTQKSLLNVYCKYYNIIYNKLGLNMYNDDYYIPEIDYSKFYLENINNYISENNKFKILICNGNALSNQSSNKIDWNYIIDNLSEKYTEDDFILTEKIDLIKNNVLFTDDLISEKYPDLNEISYLSTFCNINIGKASGPYCFTITKNNYNDIYKTFIAITSTYIYGFYSEFSKADRILINNFDQQNILNVIDDEINRKRILYYNKNYIRFLNISRIDNKIDFNLSEGKLYNISISTQFDLNGDNNYYNSYCAFFNIIDSNISYFITLDIAIMETTRIKIKFYYLQELLNEFII